MFFQAIIYSQLLFFKKRLMAFFFLIMLLVSNAFYAQENAKISFEHLSIEDGLSTLNITDIIQDHQGFMWFASSFGLNKYDGYTITKYTFDNKNPNSLSDDVILSLFEDNDGTLWIGTQNGGLNKYIRETDSFVRYQNNPTDSTSISNNFIRKIYEDNQGTLWIGTMAGGLNKMNKEKGTFKHYVWDRNDDTTLPSNYVYEIFEDSLERLWIGAFGGLSLLDRDTDKFSTYKNNPLDPKSLNGNRVLSITQDKLGVLWVGTSLGLNKFNENEKTFSSYKIDHLNSSKNYIKKIKEDSFGNLWLGSSGTNGLFKFNKISKEFSLYKHNSQDINSLRDGAVTSIYEDRSNILWIATDLGGVSIYKPKKTSNFKLHKYNANKNSISAGVITSISETLNGDIWLTNSKGTVDKISTKGKITHYKNFKKEENEFNPNTIYHLLEDENKNVIIGSDRGLYRLNNSTNIFEHQNITHNKNFYEAPIVSFEGDKNGTLWLGLMSNGLLKNDEKHNQYSFYRTSSSNNKSLSSDYITKVYEDPLGTLWVATLEGLNKMDKSSGTFTRYQHNPLDSTSISNNHIVNLHKDYFGSLWVSTYYGLNVLNEKKGTFRHFYKKNGLPENIIYSVIEDTQNNLWIATKNYLSKFNPKTEKFKTFNKGNGMSINEFHPGASLKASNGKMYFGGVNGVIEFYPDSIQNNTYTPPIVLTDFKISNQSVPIKKTESTNKKDAFLLDKNINLLDTIRLSYLDNIFSFEFAALDYVHSSSNQYAYRMKGFNEDWILSNADNRIATYTNLDSGTYVFEVKGSNNDGIWNEDSNTVVIIITPPWWKTYWAYFLYSIIFLTSFFGFIQWRASKLKNDKKLLIEKVNSKTKDLAKKNNQLDKQNLKLKDHANKLRELDETKSRFFANVSHEFRTPLTVIIGLVNRQLSKAKKNDSNDNETIKRNANRLLQLINQLLDISKIESGEVKLNTTKQNIILETKKIILLFESFANEKEINILFNDTELDKEFPNNKIEVIFDKERFSKIISNLLSNAIKYTNDKGLIKINIEKAKNDVLISIANSGNGISAENLPFIFNRFYQIADETNREYDGTGIGLALVKELVELHKGSIEVESNSTKTTFTIKMPLNLSIVNNTPLEIQSEEKVSFNNFDHQNKEIFEEPIDTDQLEVLIVEDNADIRNYVSDVLIEENYRVIQATNGEEGLHIANTNIPDLIISDVMMPKIDGYELCKQLKENENTNHIPIIMLTAKASQENKLEGLEIGADDYLTKPFDEKELKIRVKNLITLREKLQKKYQEESFIKPTRSKVNSVQQKFLQKLKEIIENNIDNEQFSVENLGTEMFMSRSQVHRKLKAITNQSASQFIRNYRLHRAAELLKSNSGNITEIAYQVGFSSQTYFSKCFQELFQVSPSEYKSI